MNSEINKIQQVYSERDDRMPRDDWHINIYHPRHPLGRLIHLHNQQILLKMLNTLDFDLESLKVLDFGCGYGYWLRYFVEIGASPHNLTGIDLSERRINFARISNPGIRWLLGKGETIPIPANSFDLVMQSVVFSSIPYAPLRQQLAREMLRVTKPGGHILWVDHKQKEALDLSGFSKSMVSQLFENASIVYEESVHPRYVRKLYKYVPWLTPVFYNFSKFDCASWLLLLKKECSDMDETVLPKLM